MSKSKEQMALDGFFGTEANKPAYLPTPYVDSQTGQVCFACWQPQECKQRRHADSLTCIHYVAEAHGCTLTGLCITALQRHIRAYQDKLDQLEAER